VRRGSEAELNTGAGEQESKETLLRVLIVEDKKGLAESMLRGLVVPGHKVGDSRLVGGRPPSAVCRRRVL
jgi:hypothetical protein